MAEKHPDPSGLERVGTHLGYWWTCPDCGVDVHGRLTLRDTPESPDHSWVAFHPPAVKCPDCGRWFKPVAGEDGETESSPGLIPGTD